MVGQLELKGCCKINPLIRAINAILIISFPILATIFAGCWLVQPRRHSSQAKIRNYERGGDFKNILLLISFQSSVLNTRYKKTPLQPFVLWCIFITGKTIKLEVFLFYLCIQFFGVGFFFLVIKMAIVYYMLWGFLHTKRKKGCATIPVSNSSLLLAPLWERHKIITSNFICLLVTKNYCCTHWWFTDKARHTCTHVWYQDIHLN